VSYSATVNVRCPDLTAAGLDSNAGEDLGLGCQAAQLAGRMHALTRGVIFPGHRTDRLDPLRRINEFLDGPCSSLPVLREAVMSLTTHAKAMTKLYAEANQLPQGLVHNDISAHNLLMDDSGKVMALIDFGDCITSFLLYDLGRICEVWARNATGHVDRGRIDKLIDAYSQGRPLTTFEEQHTLDFIAAYAAATGVDYLTGMLEEGETVTGPDDSTAMAVFMQLRG
jgi:Ser/Thr protein kinase RdoA (MazF antagonist)